MTVAQARAVEMLVETSSLRLWTAVRASWRVYGDVIVAIVDGSACLMACLGTFVLWALACGLPIRPVLKHGPRSLTCVRVIG
ncbi:hypothetical protein DEO72_LG9g1126 [Vigna unguiculata]|uniref:Uncharacterized protein n=1 Tax=Vigna unguiculata TaxID=3917 RepID=A0A4D6N218_VIGUN|nr:hypothetical protein DEO72_LG9g1126 [Vigna unguiculata]